MTSATLAGRKGVWAFVLGCVGVTIGIVMHMPMLLMGWSMHFMLAGMPTGRDMVIGMALTVGGCRGEVH